MHWAHGSCLNAVTMGRHPACCRIQGQSALQQRPRGSTGRFELSFTDGRVFTVAFRHQEAAIEAEPVLGIPARSGSDFYRLTLRFLEI